MIEELINIDKNDGKLIYGVLDVDESGISVFFFFECFVDQI